MRTLAIESPENQQYCIVPLAQSPERPSAAFVRKVDRKRIAFIGNFLQEIDCSLQSEGCTDRDYEGSTRGEL